MGTPFTIVRPGTDTPADAPGLRLELALQLLQHAGYNLPALDTSAPDAWLQAMIDGLCRLSSHDPLTGLPNRREFELAIERELDRVARSAERALLLMIDIDHFKRINDSFGHAIGDLALASVANILRVSIRPMDTVARIGGEEFAIILPNCPFDFGLAAAERVRVRVANLRLGIGRDEPVGLTISVGGAFSPIDARPDRRQWLERADAQLYRAKAEGRDRSCLEPPMARDDAQLSMFGQSWFQTPQA
jgi:diguanylate cyclase (GGDEF)-like protein